jgi:methyl-accepting chemotaxis protein
VKNFRIIFRLGLAFGVVLLFLAAISALSIINLSRQNEMTRDIVKSDWVKAKLVMEALDNTRGSMARIFQIAITSDESQKANAIARFKSNQEKFGEAIKQLTALAASPEAKEMLLKAEAARNEYATNAGKVFELESNGRRDEAMALAMGKTYDSLHAFSAVLRDMLKFQEQQLEMSGEKSENLFLSTRTLTLTLSGIALLLGALFAWGVTRSITRPLGRAVAAAEAVSAGKLDTRIEFSGRDEVAQLLAALHAMQAKLNDSISRIKASTESIGTASREIAAGNIDLSSRTEEQASSLEETAASMEQLTSTVKLNAENARQANQLARGASEIAVKGGDVVDQVVHTMGAINESSKKIADIIGVIDGIAFQTNILALNAAVEAARAGEQGRGFAVVATEVRNLAQRSAAAAKEIKVLIEDSVGKVNAGSKLVDQAGGTMDEILTSVKRVTDIMSEITAASQEQSTGIEQVSRAVSQMDEVTQQNAALVEQAAAAAESLDKQAEALVAAVAMFQVAGAISSTGEQKHFSGETNVEPLFKAGPKVVFSRRAAKTAAGEGKESPGELLA